uniref:Uncharacterized protein n=1 Tax=Anguilla anguilla TaxID=7936 RepID=A0A0E9S4B1_ANGAN
MFNFKEIVYLHKSLLHISGIFMELCPTTLQNDL